VDGCAGHGVAAGKHGFVHKPAAHTRPGVTATFPWHRQPASPAESAGCDGRRLCRQHRRRPSTPRAQVPCPVPVVAMSFVATSRQNVSGSWYLCLAAVRQVRPDQGRPRSGSARPAVSARWVAGAEGSRA
jgi:hypothetical protein